MRYAVREVRGAVERIDDPQMLRMNVISVGLFGEDGVMGKRAPDHVDDDPL